MDNLQQLRYLYRELLLNVKTVARALENENYLLLEECVDKRENIYQHIFALRNSYSKVLSDDIISICSQIKQIEEENMHKLMIQKKELRTVLNQVKHREMILKKYNILPTEIGSLLDITANPL